MKAYTLKIDTHAAGEAGVTLTLPDGRSAADILYGRFRSEDLLPRIAGLLKKNSLRLSDITEVSVHTGPGHSPG